MTGNKHTRKWIRRAVVACVLVGIAVVAALTWEDGLRTLTYHRPIRYDQPFGPVMAEADRIVVRADGFDCCGPVEETNILFVVTNREEIAEVASHIRFVPETTTNSLWGTCLCCGHPGMDWYARGRRIALTALQHGHAIRWRGFSTMRILGFRVGYGDGPLTEESQAWLVNWLARNGAQGPIREIEEGKRRRAIAEEAELRLREFIPEGFAGAVKRAREESGAKGSNALYSTEFPSAEDKLTDQHIRKLFSESEQLYSSLLRLLGCLPMRWDRRYGAQDKAYEFLVRAPKQALDEAIRGAAVSDDPLVRRGAARLIYAQFFMTLYGKEDADIERWMNLLSDEAYSDPFPENRRLVLQRLVEFPTVTAPRVLRSAVEDPDPTVRARAIQALGQRADAQSREVLRLVADGKTQVRARGPDAPKDYGQGALGFHTPGMQEEKGSMTDQEAASKVLEDIGSGVPTSRQ